MVVLRKLGKHERAVCGWFVLHFKLRNMNRKITDDTNNYGRGH
jgi:hypothetical protein